MGNSYSKEYEKCKVDLQTSTTQKNTCKTQKIELEQSNINKTDSIVELKNEIDDMTNNINNLKNQIQECTNGKSMAQVEIDKLNTSYNDCINKNNAIAHHVERLMQGEEDNNRMIHIQNTKIDLLRLYGEQIISHVNRNNAGNSIFGKDWDNNTSIFTNNRALEMKALEIVNREQFIPYVNKSNNCKTMIYDAFGDTSCL